MMKDKIEVGEYIRINGEIAKVIQRDRDNHIVLDIKYRGDNWLTIFEEAIIKKHSKNIIDLIEVGDYVNGCKVYKIEKNLITVCQEVGQVGQEIDYNYILSNEVQTIVTKEQFKEMEYRV